MSKEKCNEYGLELHNCSLRLGKELVSISDVTDIDYAIKGYLKLVEANIRLAYTEETVLQGGI